MAFTTNSSGFGSSSNSLFGGAKAPGSSFGTTQTTQQQPTSGLFGQPAQQQNTGGLFGQSSQQQQPAGGLFGQPIQQQQPAGGLFGQHTQQQQSTGGLFGQPTQQQQQPASGLFSQSTQQQQPTSLFGQSVGQQQQQQPTGGLFGQSNPSQQSGGSIFGNTSTTTNPQQLQGSGAFGSFGNFGQAAPFQQQQSTGLFANALQPQATVPAGGFGGSALGPTSVFGGTQQQQQQPSSLGLSTVNPSFSGSLLSKSMKFNDLPDELKRVLESIDTHIQGRIQISKELHQRNLGEESTKGQELIRGVHKDLINTTMLTRNDLHFTKDLKAKVEQAVQDTIVATRIVDGFKNLQTSGGGSSGYLKDHAGFPFDYFNRVTETMRQRLAWCKTTIEQIERKLSSSVGQTPTPQGISATLQAQHATFLALASKTATLDADLQKLKALYTQLWRAKTGSMRDPFNQLDRTGDGDYGMNNLTVK